jgi:hypothetical protein
LADGVVVGSGTRIDNLTVFPILAAEQPDLGPLTSLDLALSDGTAEVREIGAPPPAELALPEEVQQASNGSRFSSSGGPQQQESAARPHRRAQQQRTNDAASLGNQPNQPSQLQSVSYPGGGAQVGTLVVDNKGDKPIYVLAGTVVKGGKQDRQIGQDVIIPPKSVVPVDAFCVEQGRWTAERQGVATGGKFRTLSQLATSKVRAAAQYEGQQGKVWEKVAEVNDAHKKSTSSGTLLATLDAPELQRSRDAMRQQILAHLDQASPSGAVVGVAYAVDGKVQGVRWFANHQILGLFRDALANTAAFDAITAQAGGSPKQAPAVVPTDVRTFVANVESKAAAEKSKQTAGDNENRYSESDSAFRSKTTMGKPGKAQKVISKDYLAK